MSKKRKVLMLLVFIAVFLCTSINVSKVSAAYSAASITGKQDKQFQERVNILKGILGKKVNEVALAATVLSKETAFDAVGSRYKDGSDWQDSYKSSMSALLGDSSVGDVGSDHNKQDISNNTGVTSRQLDLLTAAAIIMADSSKNGSYSEENYKKALAGDSLTANNPVLDTIFCGTAGIVNGVVNIGNTDYSVDENGNNNQTWYDRQRICENGYIGGIYNITEETEPNEEIRQAKKEEKAEEIIDFIHYYCKLTGSEACNEGKNKACTNIGSVDAECTGITVNGVTYPLDEYVAGVLAAEMGFTITTDAMGTASAIIARSFALSRTNNCQNDIGNSSSTQNFSTDTDTYREYAEKTSGLVVADSNGVLSAVYALALAGDCQSNGDMCTFTRCTRFANSISSCDAELVNFTVPRGIVTYSGSTHYGGFEPYIASYLAENEDYSYEKLLKSFYGEDVSVAKMSSSGGSNSNLSSNLDCDECSGVLSGNTQSSDLVGKSREERIEIIGPAARVAYTNTGVWASVSIAQSILESNIGGAYDGTEFSMANNIFGVKCGRPGKECLKNYTVFDNLEESFEDRQNMFDGNSNYGDWRSADSPEAFIRLIAPTYCPVSDGCSPNYSEEVISLINQYDLKRFDEKNGSSSEQCIGDYDYNGVVTETMQKVVDEVKRQAGSGYDNGCQGWVSTVWESATGKTAMRSESGIGSAYDAWLKWGVSESQDNIPPGAMVYGSGAGYMGSLYGHVAVYIGNGQVADQGGIQTLESWIGWQTANCHGTTGWFGWGWQNGDDLTKQ